MNNQDVLQILTECQDDLNNAKGIIASLGPTTSIVPYLTKYAIIRACGAIETSYKALVADFCSRRSKKQVQQYLNNVVKESSRNPTYSNICRLLKEFDEKWSDNFKLKIGSHPDKNNIMFSLQSLVDARNDSAHGGNPTITLQDTIIYFSYCKIAVEVMDDVIR